MGCAASRPPALEGGPEAEEHTRGDALPARLSAKQALRNPAKGGQHPTLSYIWLVPTTSHCEARSCKLGLLILLQILALAFEPRLWLCGLNLGTIFVHRTEAWQVCTGRHRAPVGRNSDLTGFNGVSRAPERRSAMIAGYMCSQA